MSTPTVQAGSPTTKEQEHRSHNLDFPKVPAPKYRHAAPSAPWPWLDITFDNSEVLPLPPRGSDCAEWSGYPQSLFGNWTEEQVKRCQMLTKCSTRNQSTIHKLNVLDNGSFHEHVDRLTVRTNDDVNLRAYWNCLEVSPPLNVRVQALFVEDMTLPVLQMLGTKYNVEPFFFASSVNWIPSRYQEDHKKLDDHITVIIPFMRIFNQDQPPLMRTRPIRVPTVASSESQSHGPEEGPLPYTEGDKFVGAQAPLSLPGKHDFSFGRTDNNQIQRQQTTGSGSAIPPHGTSALRLQSLVQRTGDSVYWRKIFARSKDPTFLFLSILWYALYEWDKTFEHLFHYITLLEYDILQSEDIKLIRELHKLQEHLLYYEQLLRHFLLAVQFVRDTPNPAMKAPSISEAERTDSEKLLHAEANHLISEIERLTLQKEMLTDRLSNAIRLTFATVDINDRNSMQKLSRVTVQDSASLKKLAYLSIIYLPATYMSNTFSMNIRSFFESNDPYAQPPTETLAHYITGVVLLTFLTSWVLISLQKDSTFFPENCGVLRRIFWPFYCTYDVIRQWSQGANRRPGSSDGSSTLVSSASDAGHL